MPLEKLNTVFQSLHTFYTSVKEKGGESYWSIILDKLKEISDIAKSADWQSIQDASQMGEILIRKLSSEEISNDPKAHQHFESILTTLNDLLLDIQSNGSITISIKASLAKIKMFIDDFTYSAEDLNNIQPFKESDFSIDVMGELQKRVENLESLILSIKESNLEPEIINGIFREFHTLKGESGFLGYENLGKFCHRMETILDPLRNKKVIITREVIDILLLCVDQTKKIIQDIKDKRDTSNTDETETYLCQLENLIHEIEEGKIPTTDNKEKENEISIEKIEPTDKESTGEFASIFPLDDEEAEKEQLGKKVKDSETLRQVENKIIQAEQDDLDKEEASIPEIKTRKEDIPVYLNVETEKVDSLINITGELTTLYQMIQQNAEIRQIADQEVINNIDTMGKLFKELQNLIISVRTVSIRPLFLKTARMVRELAKKHKKNIKVSVFGETIQVDKNLISLLSGPMTHIIRNSIDHGIELPHERIEANKDETGHIKIEAKKKGSNTMIEISDDGKGIAFNRLESKAKELGLINPNAVLSKEEQYELMFEPGLSTTSKVTKTSGRGVGMDVIRSEVLKAKGKLEVLSQEGKGTTIRLIFSQTFAITEGLVIRVNRNFFVIPIEHVKEMSQYNPSKIKTVQNNKMVLIRNHYIPLIELENFLRVKKIPSALPIQNGNNHIDQSPNNNIATKIMVTVENEDKRSVLLADEVISSQEIVVKELTGSFSNLPYFSGSAILGNKRVGIILDIPKITEKTHSLHIEEKLTTTSQSNNKDKINVVEIGTNKVAMINFFIENGKERLNFAINAFKAREFIPMDMHKTVPLPKSPSSFEGVITLRGNTLPVFNLSKLLDLDTDASKPKDKIAIICEFSNKTVGFLVTGVNKVNYISWNDILPPPKTRGKISLKNIVGTILKNKSEVQNKSIKDNQEITFVLDFEKILNDVIPLYDSLDNNKLKLKRTRKLNNTVLLVEDSVIMRSKMKKALEAGGITVIEAENGQEALDIVNKYFQQSKKNDGSIFDYLDMVITDIEMPQLDGYTLTKTIKSHAKLKMLPVLLHSSLSNETMVQRANEVQADGFISKSDPEGLLTALQKYL